VKVRTYAARMEAMKKTLENMMVVIGDCERVLTVS
jgi:predicted membrane chloride channel (bestrophin family)